MGVEKYWDVTDIIIRIKKLPQTYKSILGDDYDNGTAQLLVRKKLNKLVKDGELCKTSIPGTRFGQCLFYVHEKKYYILVEAGRAHPNVYTFFSYKKINRFFINAPECWVLRNNCWAKCYNKKFMSGKVLLFI